MEVKFITNNDKTITIAILGFGLAYILFGVSLMIENMPSIYKYCFGWLCALIGLCFFAYVLIYKIYKRR